MNNDIIRSYMNISESLTRVPENDSPITEDDFCAEEGQSLDVIQLLEDLQFQLKSYQDPDNGPNAEGIEMGMNMAANMLHNAIEKLRG